MNWFLSFFRFFIFLYPQTTHFLFIFNLLRHKLNFWKYALNYTILSFFTWFFLNEFYLKLLKMTLTDIYCALKIMIIQTLGLCLISSRFARAWSVKLDNFLLAWFLGSKESGNWYYALVLFFRARWFSKSYPRYFLCFYA